MNIRLPLGICDALGALPIAFAARPALACAGCMAAAGPGVRLGYYLSTAVLSLTPILIMGGGVVYVAFKRSRARIQQRDIVELN